MRRRGFTLVELLVAVAIITIIASIVIPIVCKDIQPSREAAAIQQIRVIHTAQTQYYTEYGRHATMLSELGPPAGEIGSNGANLIPRDLAIGKKSGYLFQVRATRGGYSITANPEVFGSSGRRCFYSDQTTVIHENWGPEPATAANAAIK